MAALETVFRVPAALGLLLGLVAVVLELLLGGRAAAGVRLVQLLPAVAAAVVGGTLLGLALPWLLGPALDRRASTAGPGAPVLATTGRRLRWRRSDCWCRVRRCWRGWRGGAPRACGPAGRDRSVGRAEYLSRWRVPDRG